MKKTAIIFMSLLLSASMLTSCAKQIVENPTDASETEAITDSTENPNNETEAPPTDSGDKAPDDTPSDGGNEDGGNEDDGGDEGGEVIPPSEFAEPENASIYSGTPDTSWYDASDVQSEYILTTADQLMGLNKLRNDSEGAINFDGITVKLGADMVFNRGTMDEILDADDNEPWLTVASAYSFMGTLDGQGHTISGAYLKLADSGVQGLLGSLAKNAEIKDLRVINTVVSGPTAKDKNTLGTLVAKILGDDAKVTISGVTVHSTVKEAGYETAWVGGIVGAITDAGTLTVKDSHFYGSVTTSGRSAGGILGAALNTKASVNIIDCENHGDISANCDAGGLIGTSAIANLNKEGSKNTGSVKAPTCKGELIGYYSNSVDSKNGLRPQGTNFRVMSFNVQANFDSFSTAGLERLYAVRQEILFYDPNFICFQEDSKDFLDKIKVADDKDKSDLSAYNVIAPSELGGSGNCSIFYKSGMTLKASGTKCLTSDGTKNTVGLTAKDVTTAGSRYQLTEEELSELGITSNTNMRNLKTSDGSSMLTSKSMTYGVFVISSREVIIVNVHLQHRSQNASYSTPAVQKIRLMERLKELSYVQAQIESLKKTYPDAEIVISGDFNDLVGSKTYLEVRDTFGYSSAHETAAARYGVSATWNNAFKLASQGNSYPSVADRSSNSMLDFTFISDGLKALKFRVGAGAAPKSYQQVRYTSDHLPIITDLRFDTVFPTVSAPSVYTGTPDTSWYHADIKSYVLTTADQFAGINQLRKDSEGAITFEGVTIKLGADIIINEGAYNDFKDKGKDIKTIPSTHSAYQFKGTFDGQGHSISGVYLTAGSSYRSIFGGVAGSAVIKNFVLENSYFLVATAEGKNYFGSIVGLINDSKASVVLKDITIADTVMITSGAYSMNYVGGFVGRLQAGKLTVQNCHFNGTINLPDCQHVAGFVGLAGAGSNVRLYYCHGSGTIKAKDYVAGLSVYTNDTTKTNKSSCLTGSIACVSGSNKNASFIK